MENTSSDTQLRLTCTKLHSTLCEVIREIRLMDATAQKLINRLLETEREIKTLETRATGLRASLELAGVRPEWIRKDSHDESDAEYADRQPFIHLSLVDTCKRILTDFGDGLTKNDVEYLAARGGYSFSAKDATNSVSVTLHRLADAGFCRVIKGSGPHGNKYLRDRSS